MPCQEKQHVSGTVRSTSDAQPSYVLAGPKASWERGENTSKARCPDTKKDNNYHRHTHPSPHECQSERRSEADVLSTATRQRHAYMCSGKGRASSSSSAMRSSYLLALLVGLAGLKDTVA